MTGEGIGESVERREDPKLVTGHGEYLDDIEPPGTAYAAFARGEHAHARLDGVDIAAAESREGVLAAYTAADLAEAGVPGDIPQIYRVPTLTETEYPLLAREKVRYQGQPVAVVVAEDPATAEAAAAAVDVDAEPLDAVVDPLAAGEQDAPTIHESRPDNVAFTWGIGDENEVERAFETADRTVELEYENQRINPNPIEPRGALAEFDPYDEALTVTLPSQQPFLHKTVLSNVLGHPERKVRVRAPDVGGGFGCKSMVYPDEAVTAFAAMALERPVKWIETRSEAFQADEHARDQTIEAAVAVEDGDMTGLRVEATAGIGGELGSKGCLHPSTTFGLLLSGQYDLPAIRFDSTAMYTNTTPVGVYRGVGRAGALAASRWSTPTRP
jgi:carbon-monoxide dehydrogenase large subunit